MLRILTKWMEITEPEPVKDLMEAEIHISFQLLWNDLLWKCICLDTLIGLIQEMHDNMKCVEL